MEKDRIISISLKSPQLESLNSLTKDLGLKSRSETIRKSLKLLEQEQKSSKTKGKISGVLIIIHNHSKNTLKISHQYQSLIKNHNHSHLSNHKCIDTFIIQGQHQEVRKIIKGFNKDKKTTLVKLIIIFA